MAILLHLSSAEHLFLLLGLSVQRCYLTATTHPSPRKPSSHVLQKADRALFDFEPRELREI